MLEQVTGRLTKARAALSGAASGAWFGLFVGVLLGLFTTGNGWLATLAVALVIGAVWGALFGFLAHAMTGGRRDFSAIRSLTAAHYDVIAICGAGRPGQDPARSGRIAATRLTTARQVRDRTAVAPLHRGAGWGRPVWGRPRNTAYPRLAGG